MRRIGDILKASGGTLKDALTCAEHGVPTSVFGLSRADTRLFCTALDRFCYVCADPVEARAAFVELSLHFPSARLLLPKTNVILASGIDNAQERARALYEIASGECNVVVTTAEAMMQILPPPSVVTNAAVEFFVGAKIKTTDLLHRLTLAGYARVGHVEEPGQFALRGDITDIMLPDGRAARIEFFGYDCESVRELDVSTQAAGDKIERIAAYPITEILFDDKSAQTAALNNKGDERGVVSPVEHKLSERLNSGADRQLALSLFDHVCFNEYCGMPIIIEDCKRVYDNCKFCYSEHASRAKRLITANEAPYCVEKNVISEPSALNVTLCFHPVDSSNRFFSPDRVFKLKSLDLPQYGRRLTALADDVSGWKSRGFTVYIGADIKEALADLNCFDVEYIQAVADGGVFFDQKIIVIGMRNVGQKRDPFAAVKRTGMSELPKPGDYVVHESHGIGICEAVGAVDFGDYSRDYITVRYAAGDMLYVPVENMSRLNKYDFTDTPPRLSKLSGGEFERVKSKVKARLKSMAFDLIELYAKREAERGKLYPSESALYDEFCADFPYVETPDQTAAIDACIGDLTKGKIMDRLICGDVGFGKTEVALRVAFRVIAEGGQVAFLSPTTVLCHQHFQTTKSRMDKFGINVVAFSRAEGDSKRTLAALESGAADIVCGTHKLLGGSVKFKNLELLILDEEQKFGVSDKEKIKNLKTDVNVLTLSATPIPRTLHMAMSGIRDVSMLETPPTGRLPAQVYVTEYSDALAVDAITREIARGGQVFIVYNYINGSSAGVAGIMEYAGRLAAQLDGVRIIYAHGKMEKHSLNAAVETFARGDADVLIATTIIENGIDIPNANTMIVYGAENLGLSQMYQLKGRVGRSDRVAQVYFTYREGKTLTPAALERLESISRYTDLGSGVKIAEQDMRIRGVGNVFGAEQHGHIVSVGYAMYCKLLREAVNELKGKKERINKDPVMKVDFSAIIPKDFCDSQSRIEIYRRISTLSSINERDALIAQIKDSYETVPAELKNLCNVGLIKNLASGINAVSVTLLRSGAKIEFAEAKDVPTGFKDYGGCFNAVKTPIIVFDSVKSLLRFLCEQGAE